MSSWAVILADVVSFVAFTVAVILTLTMRVRSPLITKSVRYVFAVAMGLYVFVGLSNVLEHAGLTADLDAFEDYVELLFLPALAWVASTMYLNHQLDVQHGLARSIRLQNDLLLSIVDTVPGGIIVLDLVGGITFSNEGAERILGLQSDTMGSVHLTPSWVLRDPMTGTAFTLADIVSAGTITRRTFIAEWPDNHATSLTLSATPMNRASGERDGSVVAFEDTSGR
jgi:PAS domain-containing protein